MPDWLDALPCGRPVVYVTVGGGSDSVRALDFLSLWNTVFADSGWDVVISTGGQAVPHRLKMGRGMQVLPWVPGPAMIDRADAVLFHGGYGTMMETVQAGTPSVVIPFHSEQECNGRRLEHNGVARVLAPGDDDLEPVEGRWGGGTFVTMTCSSLTIQPHQVRDAVSAVLQDDGFRTCALQLQHRQAAYKGAAAATELIKTLIIL
jgi:UDP:flavonoid glycosyltransferase YjiC (YdhE family)